jgi:glyoxylase I family protein
MSDEPRRLRLRGLHHVTAICRDLDATTAFYRDVLGLTLVERSTNDDDPGTRHFWFGNPAGDPGTLVSFLEYPELPEGRSGPGATHHFAFIVESPEEQVAWVDYLRGRGVPCTDVFERGGFRSIYLRDPDGHIVEVATRGPGLRPRGVAGPAGTLADGTHDHQDGP